MLGRARDVRTLLLGSIAVVLSGGCGRTIEEEEPPEFVEHRVEPCRTWCSSQLDPECGARPEDRAFRTIDECVESCASVEPGGWEWARQEDGTDACAKEWSAKAECMGAQSCEARRSFFQRVSSDWDYPCKEEIEAKQRCFYSTPSTEREEDER